MSASEQRLMRRARAQAWVFTREQAIEEGVSPSTVLRRVRDGTWIVIHPGVYAVATSPRTWEQRAFAALLAAGDGAVVSHASAAYVWGLRRTPPAVIDITVPRRTKRRLVGVRVHSTYLPRTETTKVGAMPVTTQARMLLELSGGMSPAEREDLVIETVRRWPATARALPAVLDSHPKAKGVAALRRQLLVFDPEHAARLMSHMESRFLGGFRRGGLPPPHVDRRLRDPAGHLIARVEFSWLPDLTVEADGLRFHTTPSQKAYDDHRQNQLVLNGQRVLRYSARDLDDLPRVITEIATALAQATSAVI